MEIINQSYEIVDNISPEAVMQKLERCSRTCYKSEDKIKEGSAEKLLNAIIKREHTSVLEHFSFTVRFITDRGVTHELVRHRLASFSQESTRYVNYKGGMQFILPIELIGHEDKNEYAVWIYAMGKAEESYQQMLECGCAPQLARSVLPNSLKTEICVTANIREWRWIFLKRCAPDAHPQIRALMLPLLMELNKKLPVLFSDIVSELGL